MKAKATERLMKGEKMNSQINELDLLDNPDDFNATHTQETIGLKRHEQKDRDKKAHE